MSASVFFFSVSLVPILNKRVFLGNEHVQKFPYPVAMAFFAIGRCIVGPRRCRLGAAMSSV